MSQQELLAKVVGALESLQIEYMVTGSLASSLQGEPRATHDIDLVVDVQLAKAKRLVREFPGPDYYVSESAVQEAVRHKKMFNLLDTCEGDKIDFWLLTPEPFDQTRFARRIADEIMGMRVHVSTPEDTILAKLRWAQDSGGSEKQFGDALSIYEVQFQQLDLAYLERWSKELEIESLWKQLQDDAEIVADE